MYSFSAAFYFLGFAEYTEVSTSTLQPDDDPLLAAVSLLEANWISVQEIFELGNRMLTRIFVGLWPKQKAEVPDLKNLAKAFDTPNDPILVMKSLSLKRGAEGAIVFSYAPGIVSMISPLAASATTTTPISSTPATSGSVPPRDAGAASATPTSVADREAEVA
jgi:hypothetical protein